MNRNLTLIWILTLVLLLWQAWGAYDQLPEQVPSHFDFHDQPNGYSSKGSFFRTWLLAILVLNALVPGVRLLLSHVPASTINVPNREYWLATPERRTVVVSKMSNLMAFSIAGVNVMLLLIFRSIVSFALTGHTGMPLWYPMLIVPVIVVGPIIYILRTFRIPEARKQTQD